MGSATASTLRWQICFTVSAGTARERRKERRAEDARAAEDVEGARVGTGAHLQALAGGGVARRFRHGQRAGRLTPGRLYGDCDNAHLVIVPEEQ